MGEKHVFSQVGDPVTISQTQHDDKYVPRENIQIGKICKKIVKTQQDDKYVPRENIQIGRIHERKVKNSQRN